LLEICAGGKELRSAALRSRTDAAAASVKAVDRPSRALTWSSLSSCAIGNLREPPARRGLCGSGGFPAGEFWRAPGGGRWRRLPFACVVRQCLSQAENSHDHGYRATLWASEGFSTSTHAKEALPRKRHGLLAARRNHLGAHYHVRFFWNIKKVALSLYQIRCHIDYKRI
jgi:hypothetical protein